ncbi:MAG: hypothetical protein CSA39_03970 [Flavobacteriales bacterium]|nr:MAG: hypothetical protein CSA39_03970 [Flavobacteriales bacterium]
MTEKHQLLTDDQFEQKFKNCDLPKPLLTDDAYFRLAYIHVVKYGKDQAIINLQKQLAAYEIKHGNHIRFTNENIKSFILHLEQHINSGTAATYRSLLHTFPKLKQECLNLINSEVELQE